MDAFENKRLSLADFPDNVDGLKSRPILEAGDKQKLSFVRHTDARTALARGLAEYISQKSITWTHGRLVSFRRVIQTWGEPEVPAEYPSGVLVSDGPAVYDDSTLSPELTEIADGTGRFIRISAELVQPFAFIVWCTDPVQRQALTALVEDALEPAEFMTGLRLELPYYFNVRATFEKLDMLYDDSPSNSIHRWRRSIFSVVGHIPQVVPVGDLKRLDLRSKVEAREGAQLE